MLTDQNKQDITQLLTNISGSLPNYKPRFSQRKMIAEVANALSRAREMPEKDSGKEDPGNQGESIVVVEGPTGTGKSLAYILAAGYMAKQMNKKLVISSATVALQQQLVNRDIPFFVEYAGFPLTYSIAKGRGRYVCEYHLHRLSGEANQNNLFDGEQDAAWERQPEVAEVELLGKLSRAYRNEEWNGDRDALPEPMKDGLWSQITTDSHGCLNRNCPNFKTCAQFKSRKELKETDIIVANYDLLLSDLALGGGKILPDPEETFYVLDEAHHVAKKAVNTFSAEHQIGYGVMTTERLATSTDSIVRVSPGLQTKATMLRDYSEALAEVLNDIRVYFDGVEALQAKDRFTAPHLQFEDNELPETLNEWAQNILGVGNELNKLVATVKEDVEELRSLNQSPEKVPLFDQLMTELGTHGGRLENILRTWALLLTVVVEDRPPIAKWVTTVISNSGRKNDYFISASPISAAASLSALFWTKAAGVVLTSATISSMGNLKQLLNETGLRNFPQTQTFQLSSPFDHYNQGELVIPKMRTTPKTADLHTQEVIELLPQIIKTQGGNGALVLFSSRKQMKEVADGLPAEIRAITQLQGEKPKDETLAAHCQRIDAGQPSILFGLASFAEGLDLPGAYCNHVVISKLPFAVPDNPVAKTLSAWVESRGGNPFMQITVPDACLKLIQAVGRLIRTEEDTGMVTILDTRIETTRYGKLILNSLPPFRTMIFGKERQRQNYAAA